MTRESIERMTMLFITKTLSQKKNNLSHTRMKFSFHNKQNYRTTVPFKYLPHKVRVTRPRRDFRCLRVTRYCYKPSSVSAGVTSAIDKGLKSKAWKHQIMLRRIHACDLCIEFFRPSKEDGHTLYF